MQSAAISLPLWAGDDRNTLAIRKKDERQLRKAERQLYEARRHGYYTAIAEYWLCRQQPVIFEYLFQVYGLIRPSLFFDLSIPILYSGVNECNLGVKYLRGASFGQDIRKVMKVYITKGWFIFVRQDKHKHKNQQGLKIYALTDSGRVILMEFIKLMEQEIKNVDKLLSDTGKAREFYRK